MLVKMVSDKPKFSQAGWQLCATLTTYLTILLRTSSPLAALVGSHFNLNLVFSIYKDQQHPPPCSLISTKKVR